MNPNAKVQFILPGFLNYGLNEILIDIYENHPEITMDDSTIYSFFGSFPSAIWNGGRPDVREPKYTKKQMKKVRDFYNKKGIVIAFTFTNPLIKEEHLDDEYCNLILNVFNNGMNEVLVNSPILEKYIRENYPKYKINQSITTTENRLYALDGYHLGVLRKNKNQDFKYLETIPLEDRNRLELLCNENCENNCKYTFKHYEEMANIQLGLRDFCDEGLYGVCKYGKNNTIHDQIWWVQNKSNSYISPEDILNKYVPLGFKYYKICGRERFFNYGINSVIFYCIKPKFQRDVRIFISERTIFEYEKDCFQLLNKIQNNL